MRGRIVLAAALAAPLITVGGTGAAAEGCDGIGRIDVPGAVQQKQACLDDLTTAGTTTSGHTNPDDWSGLHASGTENPTGVPGVQVDGYFPDESTSNTNNGWAHDAQFVIRLPEDWNGRVVITGAPGVRRQYANDYIISDWVLDKGYAFASTDKGNTGLEFYKDGARPGDAVAEWHYRVTQLTSATKQVAAQYYGERPHRTYMTGISNGGYLTRWALENHPKLYDGGVDWEGTLLTEDGPNLFTYLPAALRNYPAYRATGDEDAHQAMIDAGFEPGSEFLWDYHYAVYWDLTQRIYREEFDPDYDGALQAGIPFCQPGMPNCDADYDYASRPESVHDAVGRVSNTGDIGKPMITLHGTLDALLPIRTDSDVYRDMVRRSGKSRLHRYYVVEDGNHVDGLYDDYPDRLRPILPCYRAAFDDMVSWVEDRDRPARSGVIPSAGEDDPVNDCTLAQSGRSRVPRS
ncbi:MAG: tannase/feruloyl esterase family alpha/beta hydrolase [Actinophytocola sp.]|nr:tannase/feruloyl esterase family alpha/beta hydrolase [Actinophytocola sp.]